MNDFVEFLNNINNVNNTSPSGPAPAANCVLNPANPQCVHQFVKPPFEIKYCRFIRAATPPAAAAGGAIANADGGHVVIEVINPGGENFKWELLDPGKLVFLNNTGQQVFGTELMGSKVTVRARNIIGEAKVKVTRISDGKEGDDAVLNVIRVTLSKSPANLNNYGFDDLTLPSNLPPIVLAPYTIPAPGSPPAAPLPSNAFQTSEAARYSHVSIESNEDTYIHVLIEGDAVGTDLDFKPDNATVFEITKEVAPNQSLASKEFDLRLKAKDIPDDKAETFLRVRCNAAGHSNITNGTHTCLDEDKTHAKGEVFAALKVHVYKKKVFDAVVAKIHNPLAIANSSNLTAMHLNENYASAAFNADALNWTKGAVLQFKIENHNNQPATHIPVPACTDADGFLLFRYDAAGGGPAMDLIRNAFPETNSNVTAGTKKIRVAIVRKMRSVHVLADDAQAGVRRIRVEDSRARTGDTILTIGRGATLEKLRFRHSAPAPNPPGGTMVDIEVLDANGNPLLVMNPATGLPQLDAAGNTIPAGLRFFHAKGVVGDMIDYPAAGWSSDPIIVCTENIRSYATVPPTTATVPIDIIKATILHELGHRIRPWQKILRDVIDADPTSNQNTRFATSIMHYQQGGNSNCLRYLPRPLRYQDQQAPGDVEENQWERIDRS